MNRLITALVALLLTFTVACASPSDNNNNKKSSNRETPVVKAVRKIEQSVINIRTEKIVTRQSPFGGGVNNDFFNDFFGFSKTYKTQSLGSGVLIKSDGTIITNYHVVSKATKIFVMLADNQTHEAEYIGGDEIIDIAVLKIKDTNNKFTSAHTGNSDDMMLGETVIAMGNPYGLNSSITTGIVSSTSRVINVGNGYSVFLQTDALINPGNSGGPLVNLDGEVIGINTAIFKEAQGIGFSIPINTVLRVLPEILENGKVRMGYMGFTIEEHKNKEEVRLIVTRVERKSNANYIGIEKGDEILEVSGIPVSSLQAMSNMLRSYPPGSSVSVSIKRGDKTLKGKIAISDYPKNYGISVLKNNYGLAFIKKGKFITISASTQTDFFKSGDIIIAINDKEVKSLESLNNLITSSLGEVAILSIYRGSQLIRVKLPL
ncbi:MAG: serine protease [Denitrovibrio sp.]|nr:MAG: serine protease [Denitrovibrio sp.]